MKQTLERIVPNELDAKETTGGETFVVHLERYKFAVEACIPGSILDIACGSGYGTQYLAEHRLDATVVQGVDNSAAAIEYAKKTYSHQKISYTQADALTYSPTDRFDNIVSLETIEHVNNPAELIKNFFKLLKPGGRLICSVPTTFSTDANPHHYHDFTERSFRNLFSPYPLDEIDALRQKQPYQLFSILKKEEKRMEDMRQNLPQYYLTHPIAFVNRILCVAQHGMNNKYITIVFEKHADVA